MGILKSCLSKRNRAESKSGECYYLWVFLLFTCLISHRVVLLDSIYNICFGLAFKK